MTKAFCVLTMAGLRADHLKNVLWNNCWGSTHRQNLLQGKLEMLSIRVTVNASWMPPFPLKYSTIVIY